MSAAYDAAGGVWAGTLSSGLWYGGGPAGGAALGSSVLSVMSEGAILKGRRIQLQGAGDGAALRNYFAVETDTQSLLTNVRIGDSAVDSNNASTFSVESGRLQLGNHANAGANASIALGVTSSAKDEGAVAVGQGAVAEKHSASAFGAAAKAMEASSVAIGANSQAFRSGDVALGSGAVTPDSAMSDADGKTINVVSVGATSAERRIVNVARGRVDSTSTDATTGAQLHGVADSVAKGLGGGGAVNPDGTVAAPEYKVQQGSFQDVGSALDAVDKGLAALDTKVVETHAKVEKDMAALDTKVVETYAEIEKDMAALDTKVVDTNTKIDIGMAALDTKVLETNAKVDNGITALDTKLGEMNQGIAQGTMGIVQRTGDPDETALVAQGGSAAKPGNAQKLINLAAGNVSSASTHAVNGAQLYGVSDSVAKGLGGGAKVSPNGTLTAPEYKIQNKRFNDVGSALGAVDGGMTTLNATLKNIGSTLGGVDKGMADLDTKVEGIDNKLGDIETDIAQGAAGVVQRTDNPHETVLVAHEASAANPGNAQKLTNLAAGAVSNVSTDAINGAQLYGASDSVAKGLGGDAKVNPDGTLTAPEYKIQQGSFQDVGSALSAIDKGVTTLDQKVAETNTKVGQEMTALDTKLGDMHRGVARGAIGVVQRTVNLDEMVMVAREGSSANPGNAQKLINLAVGRVASTSTDAINGSQLYGVSDSVAKGLGGGAKVNPDGTLDAPEYKVQQGSFRDVGSALGAVDKRVAMLHTRLVDTNDNVAQGTVGVVQRNGNSDETVLVAQGASSTKPGKAQKLSNLAAGVVSNASTDAINGAQLYGVSDSVAKGLGGGAKVNPDGTLDAPEYKIQQASFQDVGSALGAVDKGMTALDTKVVETNAKVDKGIAALDTRVGETNAKVDKSMAALDKKVVETNTKVDKGIAALDTRVVETNTKVDKGIAALDTKVVETNAKVDKGIAALDTKVVETNTKVDKGIAALDTKVVETNAKVDKGIAALDTKVVETNTKIDKGIAALDTKVVETNAKVDKGMAALDTKLGEMNQGIAKGAMGAVQRTENSDEAVLVAKGASAAKPGKAQKLSNLAAGVVSNASTDAVNGTQLYGVSDSVAKGLGGGAKVNPDGTLAAPEYKIQQASFQDVGSALGAVDKGMTALDTKVVETNAKVDKGMAALDTRVVETNTKVDKGMAALDTKVVETNVKVDKGMTALDTKLGDVSRGLALGTVGVVQRTGNPDGAVLVAQGASAANPGKAQRLTNLAAGNVSNTSTDAVNGAQLARLAHGVVSSLGGGASINSDGSLTGPKYTIANKVVGNVGDAFRAIDTNMTRLTAQFNQFGTGGNLKFLSVNSSLDSGSATGIESIAIGPTAKAERASSLAMGHAARAGGVASVSLGEKAAALGHFGVALGANAVAVNEGDVAIGSGSTTEKSVSTPQAAIRSTTYALAGALARGTVSVGTAGHERSITNVAAGRVDKSSTDAINGSQLAATNFALETLGKQIDTLVPVRDGDFLHYDPTTSPSGGKTVTLGDKGRGPVSVSNLAPGVGASDAVNVAQLKASQRASVQYEQAPNGTVDDSRVTLGNGNAPDGTRISNVAAGQDPKDAVNVEQLKQSMIGSQRYAFNGLARLSREVKDLRNDAFGGIAGALATANLPQPSAPGANMLSAAVGAFRGQSAVAIGYSRMSADGHLIFKLNANANTRGDAGGGAGIGYQW
ncbi:YadA-like family protein [Pandoraea sp. NPDC087047]|uniref:YadA-like family protein n=1 Tax=Pandoraea sp. NPDC087047 TaxID=3364390 RepID=UPI0037F63291